MPGFIDDPNLLRQSQQTTTRFAGRRVGQEGSLNFAHYALITCLFHLLAEPPLRRVYSQTAATRNFWLNPDFPFLWDVGYEEKTAYPLGLHSLEELTREFPSSRLISSFGNEPYEILKPIPVVFRQGDPAGIVASFEKANISMVGETWLDAYKALQAEILNTLEDYIENEDQLGPDPRNQLSILRTYIKNKTAKS